MTKSEVLMSLLKQAGVTVLAGLLLSSAVVAEDAANDASDEGFGVEVSVDEGSGGAAVDLGIDDGDQGSIDDGANEVEGEVDTAVDEGTVAQITECGFEFREVDVPVEPISLEEQLPDCPDCGAGPEASINPIEMQSAALASASNDFSAKASVVTHSGKDVASKATVFAGPKGQLAAEDLR